MDEIGDIMRRFRLMLHGHSEPEGDAELPIG